MESITQAEFYKRFDEYLKDKECKETIELKKQQWYVAQLFKFDKILKEEGLTVRPGFYVDADGVHYEDKEE